MRSVGSPAHRVRQTASQSHAGRTEYDVGDRIKSNKFDEYLVQVDHDFAALKAEEVNVISNNFLELRDGGAFHNGEAVAKEIVAISQRQEFRH